MRRGRLLQSSGKAAVYLFFKSEDLPIWMRHGLTVYGVCPRESNCCPASLYADLYIVQGHTKAFVRGKNRPRSGRILIEHRTEFNEPIDIFRFPRLSLGF